MVSTAMSHTRKPAIHTSSSGGQVEATLHFTVAGKDEVINA